MPPRTWVSLCNCSILSFIWARTSWLQLLPGSPSLLGCTLPWKATQRSAGVGICLLSLPSLFPPPSVVLSAGLSTSSCGGRGFAGSGPHPASTAVPQAFVILSMGELLYVDCSWCMPTLQSVEPGNQWRHGCDQIRSLVPIMPLSL